MAPSVEVTTSSSPMFVIILFVALAVIVGLALLALLVVSAILIIIALTRKSRKNDDVADTQTMDQTPVEDPDTDTVNIEYNDTGNFNQ